MAGLGFAFSNFILFATYALAFWYGGKLIRDGTMDFGQVLKVFFAIVMSAVCCVFVVLLCISPPDSDRWMCPARQMGVGQTAQLAPDAAKAQIAANAVFELMDAVPPIDSDLTDPAKVQDATFAEGGVVFENVKFQYPTRQDVQVFNGLNLRVAPKTTVALVGASGSGKSTVVQLLQRFYDPVDPAGSGAGAGGGRVLIDGQPLHALSVRQLRRKIGIVSQEPVLFSGTIAENIKYGAPDATEQEMIDAAKSCNIHGMFD